jgi:ankyrin repeat protein
MTPCKPGETRDRTTKACRPKQKPGRKSVKSTVRKSIKSDPSDELLRKCKTVGEHGVIDLKKILLRGANINVKGKLGKTPLMLLAEKGNVDMIHLFVLNNADVTSLTDKQETVLHFATEKSLPQLLQYTDIPINQVSTEHKTALYNAVVSRSETSVKLLLQHGATVQPFHSDFMDEVQLAMVEYTGKKGNKNILLLMLPYLTVEQLKLYKNMAEFAADEEYDVSGSGKTMNRQLARMMTEMYTNRMKR